MRRYQMENGLNMRDLGGYPVDAERCTAFGAYVRSDAPVMLSAAEVLRLKDMGISTAIDLRTPEEIARRPSALSRMDGFAYHAVSLMNGLEIPKTEADIPASYMSIVEGTDAMAELMRIFADAPAGVRFHCTAGKDRTGVTAALPLSLAGVG